MQSWVRKQAEQVGEVLCYPSCWCGVSVLSQARVKREFGSGDAGPMFAVYMVLPALSWLSKLMNFHPSLCTVLLHSENGILSATSHLMFPFPIVFHGFPPANQKQEPEPCPLALCSTMYPVFYLLLVPDSSFCSLADSYWDP